METVKKYDLTQLKANLDKIAAGEYGAVVRSKGIIQATDSKWYAFNLTPEEVEIKENAAIIGLSALMTTTMMRMADVVKLRNDKSCSAKVIIGGACVTPSFANEIGADDYSSDAADCVRVVKNILAKK